MSTQNVTAHPAALFSAMLTQVPETQELERQELERQELATSGFGAAAWLEPEPPDPSRPEVSSD